SEGVRRVHGETGCRRGRGHEGRRARQVTDKLFVRVNDAVIGAVLLVLSLAVVWHVRGFPTIPGQPYGAALYPFLIVCWLGITSLLLIVKGLRSGQPMVGTGEAAGVEHRLVAFATTVAALLFYLFFAERLGFLVCSA